MNTPVLLIVFNRPDLVKAMMERLRAVRPARLYVAADGPRPHVPGDVTACAEVRRLVRDEVDWPCDLRLRFRDENLNVKYGPADAIGWLFEHEERGIILEDDIVAGADFFRFCEELLDRYRDDPRVASISGTSYWQGAAMDSYYATSFTDIWGWATWRDRWADYDITMRSWPAFLENGGLARMPGASNRFVRYWHAIFDLAKAEKIRAWDYQWMLTNWVKGRIGISPTVPLIRNDGFGAGASTNIVARPPRYCRPPQPLEFPLKHPVVLVVDDKRERRMWAFRFYISASDDLIHLVKTPPRILRRWLRAARGRRGRVAAA